MKWSILSGDVDLAGGEGLLISPVSHNGDFSYWLVIEIINWEEAVGTEEAKSIDGTHNVSLSVVAPSECPVAHLRSAIDCCGCEGMEIDNPAMLVEMLHNYGIKAVIWNRNGGLRDLLRKAKEEARICECFTFGFAMDRIQNGIGSTGWDFLKGDLTAGLRRLASLDIPDCPGGLLAGNPSGPMGDVIKEEIVRQGKLG